LRKDCAKTNTAQATPILTTTECPKRDRIATSAAAGIEADRRVSVCGLVIARLRPGTAKGVIFATLEDETGVAQVII
jgi:error-prone DNA polymerase